MTVTVETVLKIYELLLTHQLSYDEADRWAWKMMQLANSRNLQFEPAQDERLIWALISFLYSIDMPTIETRKPARGNLDVIDFLKAHDVYSKLQST